MSVLLAFFAGIFVLGAAFPGQAARDKYPPDSTAGERIKMFFTDVFTDEDVSPDENEHKDPPEQQ